MEDTYCDVDEIPEHLHIQPYMFEPTVRLNGTANAGESSEESEEESSYGEALDRRLNTIW